MLQRLYRNSCTVGLAVPCNWTPSTLLCSQFFKNRTRSAARSHRLGIYICKKFLTCCLALPRLRRARDNQHQPHTPTTMQLPPLPSLQKLHGQPPEDHPKVEELDKPHKPEVQNKPEEPHKPEEQKPEKPHKTSSPTPPSKGLSPKPHSPPPPPPSKNPSPRPPSPPPPSKGPSPRPPSPKPEEKPDKHEKPEKPEHPEKPHHDKPEKHEQPHPAKPDKPKKPRTWPKVDMNKIREKVRGHLITADLPKSVVLFVRQSGATSGSTQATSRSMQTQIDHKPKFVGGNPYVYWCLPYVAKVAELAALQPIGAASTKRAAPTHPCIQLLSEEALCHALQLLRYDDERPCSVQPAMICPEMQQCCSSSLPI